MSFIFRCFTLAMLLCPTLSISQSIPSDRWQVYSTPLAGFSVLLPGEPQESAAIAGHSSFYVQGAKEFSANLGLDVGLFSVTEWIYPDKPDGNFDSFSSRIQKDASSRIVAQKDVVVNGLTGRWLSLVIEMPGRSVGSQEMFFVTGNRLFQLLALSANSPLDQTDINRFFQSFRVTGDAKEWKPSRLDPKAVIEKDEDEPPQDTGFVTSFQCPVYPSAAKSIGLQGNVRARVTTDGENIVDVKANGHPILAAAAADNIRSWKIKKGSPIDFSVDYFYVHQGTYEPDPIYHCQATLHLPNKVEVSTDW